MASQPRPSAEDIRTVTVQCTPDSPADIGSRVPNAHMRHILALKHVLISGAYTSGIVVNTWDSWGTSSMVGGMSNHPVDVSVLSSGDPVHQWPTGPRPDMPIAHVKMSGICKIQTSGAVINTTMVYFDKPGGII
ncbi:MAG: hypothetical protein KAJ39_00475 [Gammaproteobacteria bacterium]|nr:hypothetical protein [Gammaproteobacteria bacterium]